MSSSNIILVGFMGTGKTVVGQRLAARLRRAFLDTDALVVRAAGQPIPGIFAAEGETGFRDRETAVVRALAGITDTVVATGGGILVREENLALLRQMGPLVCLTAPPPVILERTRPWAGRPMLSAAPDPLAAVEQLLSERAARYALADLMVETSDKTVEEVVDEICRELT